MPASRPIRFSIFPTVARTSWPSRLEAWQRADDMGWDRGRLGHAASGLLGALGVSEGHALMVRAKALDKHYVLTRYPNGFTSGAPMDYYTDDEAAKAIEDAEAIIGYCESLLVRPHPNR